MKQSIKRILLLSLICFPVIIPSVLIATGLTWISESFVIRLFKGADIGEIGGYVLLLVVIWFFINFFSYVFLSRFWLRLLRQEREKITQKFFGFSWSSFFSFIIDFLLSAVLLYGMFASLSS